MQHYQVWLTAENNNSIMIRADSLKVNTGCLVFYNKEDGEWTVVQAVAADLWDSVERVL